MGIASPTSRVKRPFRRRITWIVAAAIIGVIFLMGINRVRLQAELRRSIVRSLPPGCGIMYESPVPTRLRNIIGDANCRLLFDRPLKLTLRCDESYPALPENFGRVEELNTLREFEIRNAYIPAPQLSRIPAPPSVRKLRMANYYLACSDTCVVHAADTAPEKPELAWTGRDMAFLNRFTNLTHLDLRSLWLKTGVTAVIGALPQLEELSIDRCDYPSEELPSLAALPKLRVLKLWFPPRALRDLTWIGGLKTLEEVDLIACRIDESTLATLATLPNLKSLRLDYSMFEGNDFAALETFPQLRVLTLQHMSFSNGDKTWPTTLKHLEWLDLRSEHRLYRDQLLPLLRALPHSCEVLLDHAEWAASLPPHIAVRFTTQPRKELEFPSEY